MRFQGRRVAQTAQLVKHLGYTIVCEHGDFVDIVEFSKVLAVEAGPEVRDQNLSSLVQPYLFTVEDCLVAEAGKILGEEVNEASRGVVDAVDAVCEAAVEFLEYC